MLFYNIEEKVKKLIWFICSLYHTDVNGKLTIIQQFGVQRNNIGPLRHSLLKKGGEWDFRDMDQSKFGPYVFVIQPLNDGYGFADAAVLVNKKWVWVDANKLKINPDNYIADKPKKPRKKKAKKIVSAGGVHAMEIWGSGDSNHPNPFR